jgi:hypothetical protein
MMNAPVKEFSGHSDKHISQKSYREMKEKIKNKIGASNRHDF